MVRTQQLDNVLRIRHGQHSWLAVYPLHDESGILRRDIEANCVRVLRGDTLELVVECDQFDWDKNRAWVHTADDFMPLDGVWYLYEVVVAGNGKTVKIGEGAVIFEGYGTTAVENGDAPDGAHLLFTRILNIDANEAQLLHNAGYRSISEIAVIDPRTLANVTMRERVTEKTIQDVTDARRQLNLPRHHPFDRGREPSSDDAKQYSGEFWRYTRQSDQLEFFYWHDGNAWERIIPAQ